MSLNGILLIDKDPDMTSHDVVAVLRRQLNQREVGHTGTLDPMARGLMIMVLGEATKLSDYLMMNEKSYRLSVRLGLRTDTLDRTGQVLEEKPVDVPLERIRQTALSLQGSFAWPVPVFSAVKVNGEKLYEKGRRQEVVETPVKNMEFWGIQIEEVLPKEIQLSVHCSKGSFIRTWADQLGQKLAVGGTLTELNRLSVGPWRLEDAAKLQDSPETLKAKVIPLSRALPEMKGLIADSKEQRLLQNGQIPRDLANRLVFEQKEAARLAAPITIKVLSMDQNLLALIAAVPGQGLKIRRVFKS